MASQLPDFEKPPLVETVLGVEFLPLAAWDVRHFGLLWQEVRAEYPDFQVQPPLPPTIERFGAEVFQQTPPTVEVVTVPDLRCWFIDSSGADLLQVQKNRFFRNWRKAGSDRYPHYETLRPTFEREWDRFRAFLANNSIPPPDVVQCEVTYVNHLERGREWESFQDLARILTCWSSEQPFQYLPQPETAQVKLNLLIPDHRGRLSVALQHGLRRQDATEVLQLTLTARGRPAAPSTACIMDWFDLGREWVVRGFTDVTTRQMHTLWGRRR